MPHTDYEKLSDSRLGESSEKVRERVSEARRLQQSRFKGSRLVCNADMTPAEIKEYCNTDISAQALLRTAMNQMHLSARAFHRILKISRTIADLEQASDVKAHHVAEAIQYRPRRLQ